jgi:putative iron-regulated protein
LKIIFTFIMRLRLASAALLTFTAACGGSDDETNPVVANFAANAYAAYTDSVTGAEALRSAVTAFTAGPTTTTQNAAKTAWNASRVAYLQTEVFRFSDGPIDGNAEGTPEIGINAWPLDEVYIDYVAGDDDAGLVNDTSFNLTIENLVGANMDGKEEFVSTGYHAIEFLLWGQDGNPDGAGARAATDFVDGSRANADRRREYLGLVAQLLVDDLTTVRDEWAPDNDDNYRAEFEGLEEKEALRRILTGMAVMASAELSGERMQTALDNEDEEDEHSCFSDTTHNDIAGNLQGIENVYLGKYGTNDGAGLDDLVKERDPALHTEMTTRLAAAKTAVAAIPVPFDQAIRPLADGGAPDKVQAAIDAIKAVGDTVGKIATLLDIELVIE